MTEFTTVFYYWKKFTEVRIISSENNPSKVQRGTCRALKDEDGISEEVQVGAGEGGC
jgi:hypothetical protein